jgi:hypothetical protein
MELWPAPGAMDLMEPRMAAGLPQARWTVFRLPRERIAGPDEMKSLATAYSNGLDRQNENVTIDIRYFADKRRWNLTCSTWSVVPLELA